MRHPKEMIEVPIVIGTKCVRSVNADFHAYYNDWIRGQIFRVIDDVSQ